MEIRLQKLMADRGVASRRKSEELITAGKVKVNGLRLTKLGTKVDVNRDLVSVNGAVISNPRKKKANRDQVEQKNKKGVTIKERAERNETEDSNDEKKVYIAVNKPVGVVTTMKDELGRPTIADLTKGVAKELGVARIFPVGRLDEDTSGLILMTNDGDWANHITHPRYETEKTYQALVGGGEWTAIEISRFQSGLRLGPKAKKLTAPAEWRMLERRTDGSRKIEIKVTEGQNRQVRRMCKAVNHPVYQLQRMAIGKVKLGGLKRGEWRELNAKEVASLG